LIWIFSFTGKCALVKYVHSSRCAYRSSFFLFFLFCKKKKKRKKIETCLELTGFIVNKAKQDKEFSQWIVLVDQLFTVFGQIYNDHFTNANLRSIPPPGVPDIWPTSFGENGTPSYTRVLDRNQPMVSHAKKIENVEWAAVGRALNHFISDSFRLEEQQQQQPGDHPQGSIQQQIQQLHPNVATVDREPVRDAFDRIIQAFLNTPGNLLGACLTQNMRYNWPAHQDHTINVTQTIQNGARLSNYVPARYRRCQRPLPPMDVALEP
jgi:hypothetical protein